MPLYTGHLVSLAPSAAPTPALLPGPSAAPTWTLNLAIPHVDVAWATFWVAAFALGVAIKAAFYAKGAFEAAEADLKISKANWEMAMRAPALAVSFSVEPSLHGWNGCPRGRHCNYGQPKLIATIYNTADGKRRCDEFFIQVVVPTDALSLPERARLTLEPQQGFISQEQVVEQKLFPSGPAAVVRFEFPFDHPSRAGEFELQYRLKDDYKDYPASGLSKVRVALPIREQFEFVNPRDGAEREMQAILSAGYTDDDVWHDQYTNAFEELDAGGFKTLDERMTAATEIAKRIRSGG